MRFHIVAGGLLLLGTSAALAQQSSAPAMSAPVTAPPTIATPDATTSAATPATVSTADRRFADMAAQSGIAAIAAAQLAQSKSSDSGLKDFAGRMITDHTKADDQLMQLAAQLKLTLPTTAGPSDQAAMRKLEGLSGAQFDRSYIRTQVGDHVKAVSLFKTEASSGENPQLKAFAQQTLPVLQTHLQMARDLQAHPGAQG